ncbi:MAG: helix-turn-helix transcriptional regulator [Cyanothece sp. SIO2G6]|nr:helix-turn-helix transcriptional regulator [Cyanothece sp. SIO2G6]
MAHPQFQPTSPQSPPPGLKPSPTTESIQIERFQNPPGEGDCHAKDQHTLFMTLRSRPIAYTQTQDGKTHTGLYKKGDFTITPADVLFRARWEGDEDCLQIQLSDRFVHSVAQETLTGNREHFQLLPEFQGQSPQIEAIALMMLAEHEQDYANGPLYLDSLANVLTVNLLQQYGTTRPQLVTYEGGLPPHQIQQVLDYVDAYGDRPIQLADLAQLLKMSQFHFSRLFKQSIGLSPYQYLLQQRVERAKQLLQQTDQSIVDIALTCGFNSHSHLSKQFRKVTGVTPKAYRMQ